MNKKEEIFFRIQNFRSFEDVTIGLTSLNLLFGPNGAGKSSFLKAIRFFSHNIFRLDHFPYHQGFKPETKVYHLNDDEDILSFKENVRNNDENLPIVFEVTIKNSLLKYVELQSIKDIASLYSSLIDFDVNLDDIISRVEIIDVKVVFGLSFSPKSGEQITISLFDLNNEIEYSFIPNNPEHNLVLPLTNYYSEIKKDFLLSLSCLPFINKMDLKSDSYDFNNFVNIIKNNSGIANKSKIITDTLLLYYKIFFGIPRIIERYFLKLEHLEPIRKEPKSAYILAGGKFDQNAYYGIPALLAGDYGAMFYRDLDEHKENIEPLTVSKISEKETHIDIKISFDYSFNDLLNKILDKMKLVKKIEAHKDSENIAGWLTYTSFDNTNTSNLAQASSGLLQLLPIITALLNKDKRGDSSIKIIEQPELHLHPKLQSELATFFTSKNVEQSILFIETHSEHIVRKLQVLVAERIKGKEEIGIYYFSKDQQTGISQIKRMELEENGFFKEPWPNGFFDEASDLAYALLDAQINRKN